MAAAAAAAAVGRPPLAFVSAQAMKAHRGRFGSLARAGISLLTASRVAQQGSDFVRIIGGGGASAADANGGVGKLLVLDEFFKSPNTSSGIHVRRRDPDLLLETLIYYCDKEEEEEESSSSSAAAAAAASSSDSDHSNEEEEQDAPCEEAPRHGVQLYMESSMHSLKQQQQPRLVFPTISHAREVSAMPSVSLRGGGGGGTVRVVAGHFSRVSVPPPLHDFLMLDVSMRPGSAETFPLMASFGIVVYILEGVGIFKSTRFAAEDSTSFYQNEGHGLYIPTRSREAENDTSSTGDLLHVHTHELSHLRFLLLGAPVSS